MRGDVRWNAETAAGVIEQHRARDGAALPILHALQERFGYVDKAAIPMVAEALNLSRAEIHGVVTFYHDFRPEPVDGRILKLCRAESCQAMGCEALVSHLAAEHAIAVDRCAPGAPLHVESVYCLGNCALSPAALLDDEPIGRLDRARLDSIVRDAGGAA